MSADNQQERLESEYRLSDFIPIYGTLNYSRRNGDDTLTSTRTGLKDVALFFYNFALISLSVPSLEKILQ